MRVLPPLVLYLTTAAVLKATITWENKTIEHHAQIQDAQAEVTFTFQNNGPHPVKITKTKTSCGCTISSPVSDLPCPPGQKGQLKAIFRFGERTGTHENKITVETAEVLPDGSLGSPQTHQLSLIVHIPEVLHIQPNFLFWLPDEPPQPKTARVKVADNVPVDVLGIRVGDPGLQAILQTRVPQKEYEITITPTEETFKKGTFALVLLETTLPQRRFVLYISVLGAENTNF